MYTMKDFEMNAYRYKPVEAFGHRGYLSGKFEVNYSSILSRLICEAGRYCESYASDLFIDWTDGVMHHIDKLNTTDEDITSASFLFGFRQNGVDHAEYVFSRYDNDGIYAKHNYRSMWRLDIDTKGRDIIMTLGRVF